MEGRKAISFLLHIKKKSRNQFYKNSVKDVTWLKDGSAMSNAKAGLIFSLKAPPPKFDYQGLIKTRGGQSVLWLTSSISFFIFLFTLPSRHQRYLLSRQRPLDKFVGPSNLSPACQPGVPLHFICTSQVPASCHLKVEILGTSGFLKNIEKASHGIKSWKCCGGSRQHV